MEHGFDPLELPPDRFFNWIYTMLVRNREEHERAKIDAQLLLPVPGQHVHARTSVQDVSRTRAAQMFRKAQGEMF